MNPKLQLAKATMKLLRARRCVQRSVVLRLTNSEAAQLNKMLDAFRRDYDDNDGNRTARLLAYEIGKKLTAALAKEKQHNAPDERHAIERKM